MGIGGNFACLHRFSASRTLKKRENIENSRSLHLLFRNKGGFLSISCGKALGSLGVNINKLRIFYEYAYY